MGQNYKNNVKNKYFTEKNHMSWHIFLEKQLRYVVTDTKITVLLHHLLTHRRYSVPLHHDRTKNDDCGSLRQRTS